MKLVDLWQQHDSGRLRLQLPRFSAEVTPSDPATGLANARIDGVAFAAQCLLGLVLPGESSSPASVEYYVRGRDLVATYNETATRPLRAQVYWRVASALAPSAIAAIELLASVQTSRLDACPRLSTRTVVASGDVLQLASDKPNTFVRAAAASPGSDRTQHGPECFLFRPSGAAFSYAEMTAAASEAEASELQAAGDPAGSSLRLAHHLFAEHLEKGVILRTWVLGVVLDRAGDAAAALDAYRAFPGDATSADHLTRRLAGSLAIGRHCRKMDAFDPSKRS